MRKLKINAFDLAAAFENSDLDAAWYLDTETGEVVPVSGDAAMLRNELLVGIESLEVAMRVIEKNEEIPDWQRAELLGVVKVDFDEDGRYLKIPQQSTRLGYEDMGTFIDSVTDARLQEELADVIRRSKPFRRFKDTLSRYPDVINQWYKFRDERQQQRMIQWLRSEEIEPIFE